LGENLNMTSEIYEEASPKSAPRPLIIGAGPAGLTAALEFIDRGIPPLVLESDSVVGGISRTVERNGWRFDIGGHRFFTKVARVDEFWHRNLPQDDFLRRPRLSRIFYKKKFFDYPLKPINALTGLGLSESIRCISSYVLVRIRPPRDLSNFEGWTAARFGWRLYRIFFKTYTEKVWGVPATEIQADWAAQRIKNLSLFKAITNAILPTRKPTKVTSLIDSFKYPKLGPGMLWERCASKVVSSGGQLHLSTEVVTLHRSNQIVGSVTIRDEVGERRIEVSSVISSMPLGQLVLSMVPSAPKEVCYAATRLKHRDFLTVALVLPDHDIFPDNWIYIHDPSVNVGRIQNFRSWSPFMVKEGYTCLGLEYFVSMGDQLWNMTDEDLIQLAKTELALLRIVNVDAITEGYVVRMPKAYPMYDGEYASNVKIIREWLSQEAINVFPVGRNGMHRYNNQDHSMLTAMLAVENACGAKNDIWSVNVEDDYHEEVQKSAK
jgi:protoporphyrinogen oxidase